MAMASAHCGVFSLFAPSSSRRTPSVILVSSKLRHRKNYLRPKILKTLTKPIVPFVPPQPILFPQEECDLCVQIPADETHGEDIAVAAADAEPDKLEELQVSEVAAEHNDVFGDVSATTIVKYGGMYLVGAFVFQSIYSVWILGNYNSDQKDGDLEINGREKRNTLFNGNGKTKPVTGASNVFDVEDQLVMQKKIEEIKLMAREARRIELEKKEEEDEDPEIDDESTVSSHRLDIEREIGARLLKLQNSVNSNMDSSAALKINTLGNSAAGVARDDNKNVNQGNEALIFKKKFKFRSPSAKVEKTPKGFPGTRNGRSSDARKRDSAGRGKSTAQNYASDATDHAQNLYEDKRLTQQNVVTPESSSSVPSEERGKFVDDESVAIINHGKNLEGKMETPNTKTEVGVKTKSSKNGGVQETGFGISSLEVIQSKELRTQNSQGFVEENQDTGPIFEKDGVHSLNGSSRHGLAKKSSAAKRVKVKQANANTDVWWLNLRYVLVIFMQRGSNGEGPKGLYSLKFTSKEQDQSDDSYTVAFEDHADAYNFCFLLESFFKDLGDFSADAVPMSIQELNEEIISHAEKVVVVKKRQLQLYAGQPLTDVEMALCSIIEQDRNEI
ncbi:uncharacterized protein LOC133294525 [Gastrolobium bilobum]|uniref:uncharacterized protein LOC133294525 n=1 Tax=Gastrolobium bilobum TaxID=150636 RepID=UPI002AB16ABC|nr:uncharacterized protein LOC133294525 [Gastrolobium bilobum]